MRETVKREADGSSVSYGWHLSLNLLKVRVMSVSKRLACISMQGWVHYADWGLWMHYESRKKPDLGRFASAADIFRLNCFAVMQVTKGSAQPCDGFSISYCIV